MEIDLHGYYPTQIKVAELIRQAWEMGASEITLIHGHGRNRDVTPGFVNTNTGYFGLCIRRAIRGNKELKLWAKVSLLDCSKPGSTTLKLKKNPCPTRAEIEFSEEPNFAWRV